MLHLELYGMPNAAILTELGWANSDAIGTYWHLETPFTLEILRGPLAVGGETLRSWDTHRKGELVLHVISPTDSVKDRLASAIHFKDPSAARQAAEVAKLHQIDFLAVKEWCKNEGGQVTYAVFERLLES